MIPWLPFERRWRDTLLEAMVPVADEADGPTWSALALDGFWPRFRRSAPPLLRFGFRAAVWMLSLGPLFFIGRPRTFRGLSADDRDRMLERADHHKRFLVRQMSLSLKLLACWGYFSDGRARRAVGGEGVDDLAALTALDDGEVGDG